MVLSRNVALVLAILSVAPLARADSAVPPVIGGIEALQADVRPIRDLIGTNSPARLRFTLSNPSPLPIEFPLPGGLAGEAGIGLPLELILGTTSDPALSVAFNEERAVPVPIPANLPADADLPAGAGQPADAGGFLRLAPGGVIGAEIDLNDYLRSVRYPGHYRIEWRALNGRIRPAVAELRIEARKQAVLVTDFGKATFTLFYDEAPRNVEGFLELTRSGYYNGKSFHRLIPGFLIQGGCPRGDGTGIRADGRLLPAEFHRHPFEAGTLAMARKPSDPNSASCQFFVTLSRAENLDGSYTIIGQATDEESLRTLQAIASIPTDSRDRPTRAAVIRSMNLVDVFETRQTGAIILPPAAAAPPAPPASSPNAPAAPADAVPPAAPSTSVQVVTPTDLPRGR
jgi:peptidyl-prolyl cis-trans isomerase B (cyclophilin B)